MCFLEWILLNFHIEEFAFLSFKLMLFSGVKILGESTVTCLISGHSFLMSHISEVKWSEVFHVLCKIRWNWFAKWKWFSYFEVRSELNQFEDVVLKVTFLDFRHSTQKGYQTPRLLFSFGVNSGCGRIWLRKYVFALNPLFFCIKDFQSFLYISIYS